MLGKMFDFKKATHVLTKAICFSFSQHRTNSLDQHSVDTDRRDVYRDNADSVLGSLVSGPSRVQYFVLIRSRLYF